MMLDLDMIGDSAIAWGRRGLSLYPGKSLSVSCIYRSVHRRPHASITDLRVEWSEEFRVGVDAKILPQMRHEKGFGLK